MHQTDYSVDEVEEHRAEIVATAEGIFEGIAAEFPGEQQKQRARYIFEHTDWGNEDEFSTLELFLLYEFVRRVSDNPSLWGYME